MTEVYPLFDEEHKYGLVKIGPKTYQACERVPCCRRGTRRERWAAEQAEREDQE